MKLRCLASLICLTIGLLFSQLGGAAIVFKAGEKMKYVPPGEEEMNGNAEELFHIGQVAEQEGNTKRAIKAYKTLVRRHPKDALAAGALYRAGVLTEQANNLSAAADLFRMLVEKYPSSPHFDEAIEGQFRVGEAYLAGKKLKLLGIPFATSMDRAVEVFAAVIRTAPYGKYTARAQFDIGLAREKQNLNDAALQAYQAVVDRFPNDPLAADAQYQIGYIWLIAAKRKIWPPQKVRGLRSKISCFVIQTAKRRRKRGLICNSWRTNRRRAHLMWRSFTTRRSGIGRL